MLLCSNSTLKQYGVQSSMAFCAHALYTPQKNICFTSLNIITICNCVNTGNCFNCMCCFVRLFNKMCPSNEATTSDCPVILGGQFNLQ
jgi:hypothetical protein